MDDIPPRSYGPLIETTLRVITWNVWGRYGPWRRREAAIVATLRDALLGAHPVSGTYPSDHYALQANLRY